MTTMTTTPKPDLLLDQDVLELERSYWDALKDRDVRTAGRLTASDSTIVGASGVSGIDAGSIGKMIETAPYRIKDYRIDPLSVRVNRICDDAVAIAYKVHEDLEVDGKPVKLDAHDASVWKKTDVGWTCLLHTESIAGDAYGRDRMTQGRN
jgi:hypothetical protein